MVMASDGILEARDKQGRLFGYNGLRSAVAAHRKAPPDSIADAVLNAVTAHSGGMKGRAPDDLADDQTLVVVKMSEPKDQFEFGVVERPKVS